MRVLIFAVIAIALTVSAESTAPNTEPAAATKSGSSISHFDTKQKAETASQTDPAESQVLPCGQTSPCYVIEEPQAKTREQQAQEDSLDALTRRYMWATIIGVCGAWIGLGILIWQTIAVRQTSQRQLRAYVLCDSSAIFNVANPVLLYPEQVLPETEARITNAAAGPGAIVHIKNTGQTPAFKVLHWGYICFREYPLRAALPTPLPIVGIAPTSVLGPDMVATKLLEHPGPLTPAQINDLRNGTGAIYVYGDITYVDAFGKKQFTRYRSMHHIMGGAIGVSTNLSFHDEGNEAS